jgi:hypothetical protein
MGSLFFARSAQQGIGKFVANTRSAHLNSFESDKNMLGGHTREIKTQEEPQGY